ncbi:LysR family transcriptional regulator [Psychrobium sp. nBUS_13]|uniref:LysR family transcriptional regulator n=1 Tax=Psychrobium sp. nBUS_13 TaxID=3395319 RepID=UPI003EC14447
MINPVWLKTFCTLVEVGHFTQTADKLFMTQSGVSQHIKKLEAQLTRSLLIREGKTFTLTNAGKELFKHGKVLLHSFDVLEHSIKDDNQYQGKVSIASPGSIGLKLYPQLLRLQQTHSQLAIDYRFAPNQDIEKKLCEHSCDIGLMTEISKAPQINYQEIASEPLVLVTSAQITEINWQTLIQLGFIDHPDGRHHAQLLLQKNFVQFEQVEQFTNHGFSNHICLICEPVSLNLGFTVLPLHAAQAFKEQQLINIHQLEQSVYERLYLCTNNHSVINARTAFVKENISTYCQRSQ